MFQCSLIFKKEGRYLFSLYIVKERFVDFRVRKSLWQGVYFEGTREQSMLKPSNSLNRNKKSRSTHMEQREQNTEQIGTRPI